MSTAHKHFPIMVYVHAAAAGQKSTRPFVEPSIPSEFESTCTEFLKTAIREKI